MDDRLAAAMRAHLPVPDAESAAFWRGAHEGKLLVRRCLDCGHLHSPPRHHCPACWSHHLEWHPTAKRGRVYSYTVVHRNDVPPFSEMVPYLVALVDLEEGVRLVTNLVECTPEVVHVGMPVEAVFERVSDEISLPKFRPVTE